ncbi:C40 family peptidase [Arthrobacter sp. H14-L1]|uniref:C40 family peptidase n=1 Tax=Arthrobacter sp. H14-L1 TaxID=2996697 RepID=UPI00226E9C73|nr:C40 family peptidase [Arthrobacter sp. H14-L1]MCY0904802.1 C40 family peptidase [Arthrobacter sp. H14-L1]
MSSVNNLGRHRAATATTNPLSAISKAVSSNAGTVGRQAAVIAAASGLILSIGLPAQASETGRVSSDASASVQVAPLSITAPATASVSFARPTVSSAPAVVPAAVAPVDVAPVAVVPVAPAAKIAVAAADVAAADTVAAVAPAPRAAAQPAAAAKVEVPAPAAPVVGSGHSGVAAAAYGGIGHPYVWGGTTPSGWDCSGFVQWAYAQAGISIPRINQWVGMVQTSNPQPGDLVVQNGGVHVGIYVGNGMIISALNPSDGTVLLPATATGTSVFYTLP